MRTLHEMASKLQQYIIRSQQDAHNQTNMNITKYNNLKLKMDTKIHYPHVIICIGISEATFNIADGTKTDGGLGPDEKYVRKWLGLSSNVTELKEIYVETSGLIRAEDEDKAVAIEGEADEAKAENLRRKRVFKDGDSPADEENIESIDEDLDILSEEELLALAEDSEKEFKLEEEERQKAKEKNLFNYIQSVFQKKF